MRAIVKYLKMILIQSKECDKEIGNKLQVNKIHSVPREEQTFFDLSIQRVAQFIYNIKPFVSRTTELYDMQISVIATELSEAK